MTLPFELNMSVRFVLGLIALACIGFIPAGHPAVAAATCTAMAGTIVMWDRAFPIPVTE